MKCPTCGITCSNLRDICPGCYIDLREHKRKTGIPVTNASATYDDLLRKAKKISPNTNIEIPEVTHPAITSREKTIFEEMVEQFDVLPPLKLLITEERSKPHSLHYHSQDSSSAESVGLIESSASSFDPEEVSELFNFAFITLSQRNIPKEVELSLFELQTAKSSEDIVLYFELARDELEHPGVTRTFTSDIAFSEKAHVETTALEKELTKVTKQLDTVVVSLKGEQKEKKDTIFPEEKIIEELHDAPLSLKASGAAVDLFLTLVLGVVLGIGSELIYGTSHESTLWLFTSGDSVATVSIVGAIMTGGILAILLYQWICLFLLGHTVGAEIFSMRLATETGAPVHNSNRFVRGATFPLSVIALGFLPLFFGSRAIHDLASRTMMKKRVLKAIPCQG